MSGCKHLRRTYRCDIEECADCQMALSDILQEANDKLRQENERHAERWQELREYIELHNRAFIPAIEVIMIRLKVDELEDRK